MDAELIAPFASYIHVGPQLVAPLTLVQAPPSNDCHYSQSPRRWRCRQRLAFLEAVPPTMTLMLVGW